MQRSKVLIFPLPEQASINDFDLGWDAPPGRRGSSREEQGDLCEM